MRKMAESLFQLQLTNLHPHSAAWEDMAAAASSVWEPCWECVLKGNAGEMLCPQTQNTIKL